MKVTETIYRNIDDKKISLLILLGLSKAFDSVSHNILLHKCTQLKIDPFWFKSYLENRYQSVRLGDIISSPKPVEFEVPQRSILGPILFLIYINDMATAVRDCILVQFADDSQLLVTGTINELNNLIVRAETILEMARCYFQINGLNINESKTKCIFIGSRQFISQIPENTKINFNGFAIEKSVKVKNLGVYFDQYMLFDGHICDAPKAVDGFPKSSEGFPKASEGFPTPVASPPRTPTPPAAQVRQYSWRKYVKKEVCLYIRTLKPLKTKKEEKKLEFKRPTSYQNHSDVIVTSLLPSCQKSEGESQQYSVIRDNAEHSNSEMNQLVHVSQYTSNRYTLNPQKLERRKG